MTRTSHQQPSLDVLSAQSRVLPRSFRPALSILLVAWSVTCIAALIHAAEESSADLTLEVPSVLIRVDEQIDIPAREPGLLTRLDVREGDMVTTGQPLAQVDDADAKVIWRRAQLELELGRQKNKNDVAVRVATKSLEVARAELKRAEEAETRYAKSVSDSELDFLRHTVDRSKLEIEQARHELDLSIADIVLQRALDHRQRIVRHDRPFLIR